MNRMINENESCLKLRNQTTRSEETYCKVYTRKFRGYLRFVFLNHQSVGLLAMVLFAAILIVSFHFFYRGDDRSFIWYMGGLGAFIFLVWLGILILRLWFWKYTKYVVVTNEGIWLMWHSLFWRRTNFKGKRHFASALWNIYGWGEIKITDDDKARPQSPVKTAQFFDNFDYAVVKSTRLSSLFLTRFDGVQEIYFLDESDANEILEYAKEQKRRKKPKKKDMEIIEDDYDKLPDDEFVENDNE